MFCGKGGVGKTTCAAIAAYHFAQKDLRVLLVSSDPTPSLSDILERDLTGGVKAIHEVEGLSAVELDVDTIISMWKRKYGREVFDVVSSFLPVDEEIIDYIAGAPGIDQEFTLGYIHELYESRLYDMIVWDTAPAGGTLSLISLQHQFYSHLGEAAKMYTRLRRALEVLRRTSDVKVDPLVTIRNWQKLSMSVLDMLRDETMQSVVVTIPEALGINQTERIIRELEKFEIRVSGIVVNYVLIPDSNSDELTRSRAALQKKYIDIIQEKYGGFLHIAKMPLLPFEVRGLESIREVERIVFTK